MERKPTRVQVNNLYDELHFLFGIHFHVMKPLFDSLLPMICVASLQDQEGITRDSLKQEPTLVALGSWSKIRSDFQSILKMHIQLDTRPIRKQQIHHAKAPKTMPKGMW